jgi:hypothetical protein
VCVCVELTHAATTSCMMQMHDLQASERVRKPGVLSTSVLGGRRFGNGNGIGVLGFGLVLGWFHGNVGEKECGFSM